MGFGKMRLEMNGTKLVLKSSVINIFCHAVVSPCMVSSKKQLVRYLLRQESLFQILLFLSYNDLKENSFLILPHPHLFKELSFVL